MPEQAFVRFAGWAGIAAFVCLVGGLVIQSAAGPPPSFTDTAALMSHLRNHSQLLISGGVFISLALMLELVMVVGFRELVRGAAANWTSVGTLFLLCYVVAYPLGLMASGLLIAAVTEAGSVGDAAAVRALWGGGYSVLGAVTYLPLTFGTVSYALVVRATGILPRWTAWVGWIAALGALAAIPAALGGTGSYSQVGPLPAAIQGVPGLAWLLVVAISMIRRRSPRET